MVQTSTRDAPRSEQSIIPVPNGFEPEGVAITVLDPATLALIEQAIPQNHCVPACVSCNSAKGDQHPRMLSPSSWIATTLPRVQNYLKTRETAGEGEP